MFQFSKHTQPSCELNRMPEEGLFFGFPWCHAKNITDPDLNLNNHIMNCQAAQPAFVRSFFDLGAHVAPDGMTFYTGTMFPEKYHNAIFIAEHGSWNRDEKIGYRVSVVTLNEFFNESVSHEIFVNFLLPGQVVTGRPTDVLVLPDGSLLIADDNFHRISRVTYNASNAQSGISYDLSSENFPSDDSSENQSSSSIDSNSRMTSFQMILFFFGFFFSLIPMLICSFKLGLPNRLRIG